MQKVIYEQSSMENILFKLNEIDRIKDLIFDDHQKCVLDIIGKFDYDSMVRKKTEINSLVNNKELMEKFKNISNNPIDNQFKDLINRVIK